jgi:hypothetical protein
MKRTARQGPIALMRGLLGAGKGRPRFVGVPRVGFLVAGFQKGGTSSLDRYLRGHPSIGLARGKEVHFFDDETRGWRGASVDDYHAFFSFDAGAAVFGECTPAYAFWEPAYDRIRAYNPAIKLVFVVRDPISRAFSHWSMQYARGIDRLPFAEAIRAGRDRVPKHWGLAERRTLSYVERGFYGRQIAGLLERFPRGQMLFVASDTLFAAPETALAAVTDFLGVPRFAEAPPEVHLRKAKPLDYPARVTRADAAHLAGLYRDDVALFARLTGFDTGGWLDVGRYAE